MGVDIWKSCSAGEVAKIRNRCPPCGPRGVAIQGLPVIEKKIDRGTKQNKGGKVPEKGRRVFHKRRGGGTLFPSETAGSDAVIVRFDADPLAPPRKYPRSALGSGVLWFVDEETKDKVDGPVSLSSSAAGDELRRRSGGSRMRGGSSVSRTGSEVSVVDEMSVQEIVRRRQQRITNLEQLQARMAVLEGRPSQLRRKKQSGFEPGAQYYNEMSIDIGPLSFKRKLRMVLDDKAECMDFWINSTHWWCVHSVPFSLSTDSPPEIVFAKRLMDGMEGTVVTGIRAWYDIKADTVAVEVVIYTSRFTPDKTVEAELRRVPPEQDGWAGDDGEIVWGADKAPLRTCRALPEKR